MKEGTLATVLIFPRPWPVQADTALFSKRLDGGEIRFLADSLGRLVFSIEAEGIEPYSRTFQPLRIVGSGKALAILTWSASNASLEINGRQVLPLDVEPTESFELIDEGSVPSEGLVYPEIDLGSAATEVEYLFLGVIKDIDEKVNEGSRYNLIKAAGLLRQLLLDETPLLHAVNRQYKERIRFVTVDFRQGLPIEPDAHWQNLDPSYFSGARTISVAVSDLLAAPVVSHAGTRASVKDLIKACANAKGGTHFGIARSEKEATVLDFDRAFEVEGEQPSLAAIAGMCRVVIRGLEPLVRVVQQPG